ncbi:MAG: hypothetical protein PHE17_12560 [Thiothrix sp.]|uniref:hypothetical protein n=1 Tax=Thiothrix sp. TaxID=1032 RepID=UPI00261C7068|nr:hypothetical protein [Thiothrix sp.]MDD5393843.1 hypothetical protein [Thiothrix sp.]
MKIIRNVLVKLPEAEKEIKVKNWITHPHNAEVIVGQHQFFEDGILHVLISSIITLDKNPALNDTREIILPLSKIHLAEQYIEKEANLLSVITKSSKELFSPIPYILFAYETPSELEWLNETSGYEIHGTPTITEYFSVRECQNIHQDLLNDRLNGVILLSEALCHKNYMGRYRDYMRFFELAFNRKISQLDHKLYQFLQGFNEANYTKEEIKEWITHRNPSSHADRGSFAIERMVRPYTQRIEQAAYDVLYNKKDWHNPSKERRNIYFPSFFSISESGKTAARPGTELTLTAHSDDHFSSYKIKNYTLELKTSGNLKIWGHNYNMPFGKVTAPIN